MIEIVIKTLATVAACGSLGYCALSHLAAGFAARPVEPSELAGPNRVGLIGLLLIAGVILV